MRDLRGQLAAYIDPSAIVDLASGLVRIPSVAPNEGPVGRFLTEWMQASGVFDEVILQQVVPGRDNVIGVVRGSGSGPNVVLNGHLDQGEPRSGWTRDPFQPEVRDGWLYGMGLTDMKGALACQIVAASALARSGIPHSGDIVTTSVMNHDTIGLGTKFFLDSWDYRIDAAICGEPTNLAIQLAHGGAWQFEVTVEARSVHTSRNNGESDAIRVMLDLLRELERDGLSFDAASAAEGLPRIVVGMINGGWRAARTADACVARGDVRTTADMTSRSLREDFERIIVGVRARYPGVRVSLRELAYQHSYQIDEAEPVVQHMIAVHREVTESEPTVTRGLPVSAYVTDSSDFVRLGIPAVLYGPGDWHAEPNERIAVSDLVTATTVYAMAAAQFSSTFARKPA